MPKVCIALATLEDEQITPLLFKIAVILGESNGIYGSPKITAISNNTFTI